MLRTITDALRSRSDLKGWTVRHVSAREAQVYGIPETIESSRSVDQERFLVSVLRETPGPDGRPSCGSGETTILPGGDIGTAVDTAALTAGLVHNPPYSLPGPADFPRVPLVDEDLRRDPAGAAESLMVRLYATAAEYPQVRLSAAECYVTEERTHLVNSRGIDVEQTATRIDLEWVLLAQDGGRETESYVFLTRRRASDLDLPGEMSRQAHYAQDLLRAGDPPSHEGPVVLRGPALAELLAPAESQSGPLQVLGSAAAKYGKFSTWERNATVLRKEPAGDPLTLWVTRKHPFGNHAGRFDEEGIPAQRVEFIRAGKLVNFIASQRYAEYLGIPATGEFGDIEAPAGKTPAAELTRGKHVEVVTFSWFNPDPITAEFATEIRLGYLVEGKTRTPFKGGLLIGNVLDALADIRWSKETGFFGHYQGPVAARIGGLRVSGSQAT